MSLIPRFPLRGLREDLAMLVDLRRRRQVLLIALLAVAVAAFEAATALVAYGLVDMLEGDAGVPALPILGELSFGIADPAAARRAFLEVAAGFFVARAVLIGVSDFVMHRFSETLGRDVSVRLAEGYMRMPYRHHLDRNSSEMIRNALWSVNEVVLNVIMPLITLFCEAVIGAALLATLVAASPTAVLVVVAVLVPVVLLTLRIVQPRLHALGEANQRYTEGSLRTLDDSIEGIREVKVFDKVDFFSGIYSRQRAGLARTGYIASLISSLPRLILETAVFLLIVVVAYWGTEISVALLGVFGYAVLRALPGVSRMVSALNRMKFGKAAMANVRADLVMLEATETTESLGEIGEIPFERSLTFGGVSFAYSGGDHPVLHDVSFEIGKGDFVGIVGPTGAGKSTVMDLMVGLLEPTAGSITVDGNDIHSALASWQARIGLVSQDVFLIDDSLIRNIALGVADEDLDLAALGEAVDAAQLGEFVASLPDGLATEVGERGVRVSGGQKQRIAIARAIYRRPDVILLDEGTSALDTVTEAALVAALERLRGEYTMVSIAHRLASVQNCDYIVLMDAGRVADIGTFQELMDRSSVFRKMALAT